MTRTVQLLASASVMAVAALAASPASAAGTASGTQITNNVSLAYKVGGVTQTGINTSNSFFVDRKVNLSVAEVGSATTSVSPGQQSVVTTFLVTNSSNATLDLALSVSQPNGGTAAHGGTDNFDVTGVKIYVDSNTNGSFDGSDTLVTYLDELAADGSKTVFVVADVPLGRSTADVAGIQLTATASESGGIGSQGATVTESAGANTASVDTVLADTNTANGNTARDGSDFAYDDFTVLAASLNVTKTSRVISDPINSTTNPKMIPGAVVEYCVKVANASGSATATNVNVTDTLASETAYDSSFGIKLDGTVTGSTCNADGTSGGNYAAGVVTGTLSNIAAGVTRTLVFRVTVY